jgi:hypothetical protein
MAHNICFQLPFHIFTLGLFSTYIFLGCAGLGVRNAVRDPDIPDLRAWGRDPPPHVQGVLLLPALLTYRYRSASHHTNALGLPIENFMALCSPYFISRANFPVKKCLKNFDSGFDLFKEEMGKNFKKVLLK